MNTQLAAPAIEEADECLELLDGPVPSGAHYAPDFLRDSVAGEPAREDGITGPTVSPFAAFWRWPLAMKLAVVLLAALYIPVIREAVHAWLTNDNYAHGVFIIPVAAVLVWMRRREVCAAKQEPAAIGVPILAFGLLLHVAGFLLSVGFLAIVSLVPVIAGTILALHGRHLWRVTGFAVCFLAFASTVPGSLTARPSQWVQSTSTVGAHAIVQALGYPVVRHGNVLETPGVQVEVVEACSGFKKLVALLAFATLYGHIFRASWGKRLLLVASAVPIAVAANALRIAGLVAVSSAAGERGFHAAHDSAELFVLVVAFIMFVFVGKLLGCRTPRYSL